MTRHLPLALALALACTLLALALGLAAPAHAAPDVCDVDVVAEGLRIPWEVVVVPGSNPERLLVTERPGRIREIVGGVLKADPVFEDDDDSSVTVRKFLGLALHPQVATNDLLYLYETYTQGGVNRSRILRLRDDGAAGIVLDREVFDGIPSDLSHDGGRMAFGPDGFLYVTTGDVHDPELPRDPTKLSGKILRFAASGTETELQPAPGNPFLGGAGAAPYVWSLGHRHPQGIDWDASGRMWQTEHGPSGESHAPQDSFGSRRYRDEINVIVRGGDYGWPTVAGDMTLAGTVAPVVHSGTTTWAPGDLDFSEVDGLLYAPFLAGRELRVFRPSGGRIAAQERFFAGADRLRAGVVSGSRLFLTSDDSQGDIPPGAAELRRVALNGDADSINGASTDPGTPRCGSQPTAAASPGAAGPATALPSPLAPPSPAADRTAPRLGLRFARRQRPLRTGRLTFVGACDERCTVRLTGTLTGGRKLPTVRRTLRAGSTSRLTMKLSRRLRRALARDLRRRRVTATLRTLVTDAAGNRRARVVRVRVVA